MPYAKSFAAGLRQLFIAGMCPDKVGDSLHVYDISAMNNAPTFEQSLLGSLKSNTNPPVWDRAVELHEQGKYRDAVLAIFDFVNPHHRERYGNADQTEFNIPHGSTRVQVKLDDAKLSVTAPFVRMPAGAKVPIMRQVAQINFNPLNLSNIHLEGDLLQFKFECPIELCEPYKVYDVFRETCIFADSYDDVFIEKFKASWAAEPIVTRYSEKEIDQIWDTFQGYLKETAAYLDYFENKRMHNYMWDVLNLTFMKIDHYAAPQGFLKTEIDKGIASMHANQPPIEKVQKGKRFFKKLQEMDRASFEKDIYKVEQFIPTKFRGSLENIKSNFEQSYANAKQEIDAKDHISATFSVAYAFMNMYYHTNISDDIKNLTSKALMDASGKPWADAATTLFQAMERVMRGQIEEVKKEEKKSWWKSLFS